MKFVKSPNQSSRKNRPVDMIVVHYTASGSLANTITWFENPTANASAHYIVGQDGEVVKMVEESRKAWHAGKSRWKGVSSCNNTSVGIEIVNWGLLRKKENKFYCWPGNYSTPYRGPEPILLHGEWYAGYTEEQYRAVAAIILEIAARHGIPTERILGHSDIAPGRKSDPGPAFDWNKALKALIH